MLLFLHVGSSDSTPFTYHPPGQVVSGRAGKGGIFGSSIVDPGPPCCQICTKKFYHSLALLELNEHDEKIALQRFHRYRDDHNSARRKQRTASSLALLQTDSLQGLRLQKITNKQKKAGLVPNLGGAAAAGAANSNAQSTGNAYGGVDILERISYIVDDAKQAGPHQMKSTKPLNPNPDRMEGALGGGICCDVCPLWFIPQNQRLHLQGDISPEYGLLLEEHEQNQQQRRKKSMRSSKGSLLKGMTRMKTTTTGAKRGFIGSMASAASGALGGGGGGGMRTGATSRGGVGPGPSQCCNVCTDDSFPMRDINSVKDITFLEIKEIALKRMSTTSTTTSGVGTEYAPPSNSEQCCYLCSEQANGGWEGTDPFSEPTSWDQHLEDQSKDPMLMNEIANKRTWNHQQTVSNHFLAAAKAIEQLSGSLI